MFKFLRCWERNGPLHIIISNIKILLKTIYNRSGVTDELDDEVYINTDQRVNINSQYYKMFTWVVFRSWDIIYHIWSYSNKEISKKKTLDYYEQSNDDRKKYNDVCKKISTKFEK